MIDPDTPDSVQGDTPSGQDPVTTGYDDRAPDPREVKTGASDDDGSPAAKDPAAWVTGDEPMTGPQASYLDTLAQQAGETPPTGLTKAEASRAIDELQARAGR